MSHGPCGVLNLYL